MKLEVLTILLLFVALHATSKEADIIIDDMFELYKVRTQVKFMVVYQTLSIFRRNMASTTATKK